MAFILVVKILFPYSVNNVGYNPNSLRLTISMFIYTLHR